MDREWAARADDNAAAPTGVTATFGFCHPGGGINCVVDGDSLWIQGQKVRVADVDAPSLSE